MGGFKKKKRLPGPQSRRSRPSPASYLHPSLASAGQGRGCALWAIIGSESWVEPKLREAWPEGLCLAEGSRCVNTSQTRRCWDNGDTPKRGRAGAARASSEGGLGQQHLGQSLTVGLGLGSQAVCLRWVPKGAATCRSLRKLGCESWWTQGARPLQWRTQDIASQADSRSTQRRLGPHLLKREGRGGLREEHPHPQRPLVLAK